MQGWGDAIGHIDRSGGASIAVQSVVCVWGWRNRPAAGSIQEGGEGGTKKKPPPPPCLAANKKNWKKDGPMRNVRSRNQAYTRVFFMKGFFAKGSSVQSKCVSGHRTHPSYPNLLISSRRRSVGRSSVRLSLSPIFGFSFFFLFIIISFLFFHPHIGVVCVGHAGYAFT